MLASKANLSDIQNTMAEIASNIESKCGMDEHRSSLDDKVARAELSARMQEKVSFDDMKRFVALNGGTSVS